MGGFGFSWNSKSTPGGWQCSQTARSPIRRNRRCVAGLSGAPARPSACARASASCAASAATSACAASAACPAHAEACSRRRYISRAAQSPHRPCVRAGGRRIVGAHRSHCSRRGSRALLGFQLHCCVLHTCRRRRRRRRRFGRWRLGLLVHAELAHQGVPSAVALDAPGREAAQRLQAVLPRAGFSVEV